MKLKIMLRSIHWILVIGCWIAGTREVAAMHVEHVDELIAWSRDGASALIRVGRYGPEGGGSLGFRLIDPRRSADRTFEISSDFSPGGSGRPETIPEKSCRDALDQLGRALREADFAGIELRPEACGIERRRDVVGISNEVSMELGIRFGQSGREFSGFGLNVKVDEKGLEILHKGSRVVAWQRPGGWNADGVKEVVRSPSGRLLLVFVSVPGYENDKILAAAFYSPSGSPADLRHFQ